MPGGGGGGGGDIINDTRDIDLLMTEKCAIFASNCFKNNTVQKLELTESIRIKSLFGKFQIKDVPIEIMSEVINKFPDGKWQPHFEWIHHIEIIKIRKLLVPVLSLKYESIINSKLGNVNRVKIIYQYLSNSNISIKSK